LLEIDPIVEWMGLGCGRLKTLVMRLTLRGQSREVGRNVPFYISFFPVVSMLQVTDVICRSRFVGRFSLFLSVLFLAPLSQGGDDSYSFFTTLSQFSLHSFTGYQRFLSLI